MTCAEISAVVVTKGDRDITPVIDSLKHFGETIIWNNRQSPDMKVYGRYFAATLARLNTIYVQDDDTIVDSERLVWCWNDLNLCQLVCNMPKRWHSAYQDTGISLVGFGAIFPKQLIAGAFEPYVAKYGYDELFLREADRVFTYLKRGRCAWAEVPIQQLDYSTAADRMYLQQRTKWDYQEIRRRLTTL